MYDNIIDNTKLIDLIRGYHNESKKYFVFDAHVIEDKEITYLIATNDYKRYIKEGNFITYNDANLKEGIKKSLLKTLDKISKSWTVHCYYYEFETFLKKFYNISEYNYDRLLKIQKTLY